MTTALERRLVRAFGWIVAWRWPVVVAYALLLPIAVALAMRVPRDSSLEHMVVSSDPDVTATRQFQELFPERDTVFVMLETADPFSTTSLGDLETMTAELDALDGVTAVSIATVWQRSRPGVGSLHEAPAEVEEMVAASDFFRRQGFVGDGFLGLVLAVDVPDAGDRDVLLANIDRVTSRVAAGSATVDRVRLVGKPLVDAWLERETSASTARYMPLFGVFVVVLVYGLFRSWRALVTILVSLATAVAFGMAFATVAGLSFTIVSGLVPLTLMVTATASLVYLHSRFVDQPPGIDLESHRLYALANKWVAVTASVFAASVGFAALMVSNIRPIRELGLWTAGGLMLGWVVCFTLYPALQVILRTPTRRQRQVAGAWVVRAADVIPVWSYRWRWPLVISASLLATAGLAALLGVPGVLSGMRLETDALAYIDADARVAEDTRVFSREVLGLKSAKVWISAPEAGILEPGTLAGLDRLSRELERQEAVGAVVGLPSVIRVRRELAGLGGDLPTDSAGLRRLAAELEQLALTEPAVAQWIDFETLGSTYLTVTSRAGRDADLDDLARAVESAWWRAVESEPALEAATYRLAGSAVLQATISSHLVPTLTESFAITFAVIFATFVVVFRSGAARINAMVPSLFAILVTFLVMRLTGIPLNVATILIATTVLGVTENDQIHFFYHFLEARRGGASTQQALSHAIRVAGHAILFATIINAGGFLALALSDLPPMRQFGVVTSMAFALAMLADFTALPAVLWIVFRDRPERIARGSGHHGQGTGEGAA